MPVNIGPRIGIDGEAEFRKQLNNIIQQSKTLASEQKKVTAQFEDSDNAVDRLSAQYEVLTRQVDNQRERVRMLEKGLESATDQFGEADTRTQKWQQAVNEATAQLSRMEHQLDNTSDQLEKARTDQAQSEDAYARLTRAIEDQESELQRLRRQYQNAVLEFGSASTEARDLERQIQDVSAGLGKNRSAMKRADDAADDLERELDQAGDAARDLGDDLDNAGRDALSFADVVGGNIVADALGAMIEGMGSVVEESKEYRRIMASLETSSERAGYTTEETSEAFETLVGVLDDDQTAATTVANLQAIGLEQENLLELLDGVIGAWASYGDSIPIDGLAESVNETIRSGQVAGNLADVLNWGTTANERFGVSLRENTEVNEDWNQAVLDATTAEDYFNLALQECQTEADRANLVMGLFASQGLAEAGRGWQETNTALTEANEATARQREALAELAESFVPATTAATEFSTMAIEALNDIVSQVDWEEIESSINGALNSETAKNMGESLETIAENAGKAAENILNSFRTAAEQIPGITENALDSIASLSGIAADAVSAIGAVAGNEMGQNFAILNGYLEIAEGILGDLYEAYEDLSANLGSVSESFDVFEILKDTASEAFPPLQAVGDSIKNIGTAAVAAASVAEFAIGGINAALTGTFDEWQKENRDALVDAFTDATKPVREWANEVYEANKSVSESMLETVHESTEMADAMSSNAYGMMSDFDEATDNIASSASENFGQAQRSVSSSTRSMSTTAGTNAQSMRRNIANGANGAKSDVDSAFNGIESTVSGVSSRSSSYGSSMMRNYQSGVSSQKGDLSSTISSIANSIVSRLGGLDDDANRWGREIVNGMKEGMSKREQSLINQAKLMARKIKRTIEKAYDINSPSKWAESVIDYVMQGFGVGFDKGEAPLLKTAQGAMDALKDVMSGALLSRQMQIASAALSGWQSSGAGSTATQAGPTTNLGGVTIHVYAAEGQDANAIANMVMRKMQIAVDQRKQVFG